MAVSGVQQTARPIRPGLSLLRSLDRFGYLKVSLWRQGRARTIAGPPHHRGNLPRACARSPIRPLNGDGDKRSNAVNLRWANLSARTRQIEHAMGAALGARARNITPQSLRSIFWRRYVSALRKVNAGMDSSRRVWCFTLDYQPSCEWHYSGVSWGAS